MIVADPEIMRGPPYRGTRIPVELIADMLSQGAKPEEILDGYAALDREHVNYLGLGSSKDWQFMATIRAQDYTFVTNNRYSSRTFGCTFGS